ncbi:MAG: hypothetical protein K9J30_11965 [Bacteroidales bacterium]|nr:hypothetical protein [Bacteroidales bacterium]
MGVFQAPVILKNKIRDWQYCTYGIGALPDASLTGKIYGGVLPLYFKILIFMIVRKGNENCNAGKGFAFAEANMN